MNTLRLESVSFSYATRKILSDVSLSLNSGTITVLLGPNGAGKTTLLDICLGWKKPSSGKVLIEGRELLDFSPRDRGRTVALVPQRENVRFDFQCLDYVLLGRAPHLPPLGSPRKEDLDIARNALQSAGIPHLEARPIPELSGGEYQLMLIARSLAQQPKLMLLDEPTSQLDPAHRIGVLRVLKKLANDGITLLLTGHSPETAALIGDDVCLLSDGRIGFHGPPRDVLRREVLESVYGVPFEISWIDGRPHFIWEL